MPPSAYQPAPVHSRLGPDLYDEVSPARFPAAILRFRNQRHAESVGLGDLNDEQWSAHFCAFQPLPDNLPRPLALRYHGHQFRHYNPRLGDGRGFLFAQLRGPDGRLLDLGTKGSGITPWSRGGDGRLTLKGGVREVLATELLEALGVNTSKTFSLFETGEPLYRNDEPSPTRSSVLVRLQHSHVRVGTFQRLSYGQDKAGLRRLAEHCVEHLIPEAQGATDLPSALLGAVVARVAETTAAWMAAGFVHGVLNTDNINITGESFDYGPWRFLETFDPEFTAAYFDGDGLYAYGRQADSTEWALARLSECLAPIGSSSAIAAALAGFSPCFEAAAHRRFFERLGVIPGHEGVGRALLERSLDFLSRHPVPYGRFFFDWYGGGLSTARALSGPYQAHYESADFAPVWSLLDACEPLRPDFLTDPWFDGPGPVLLAWREVEELWAPIAERDDWSAFERKVADIRAMGRALGRP